MLKDELIDRLFVDREDEIKMVSGILKSQFEETVEICAVIGGIGIGKSSFINYIGGLAKGLGYQVMQIEGQEIAEGRQVKVNGKRTVILLDDIDKIDDNQATEFYSRLGKNPTKGCMIFFSDTYDRSANTARLRRLKKVSFW